MDYAARPISEFSVPELEDYAHRFVRWEIYLLVRAEGEISAAFEGLSATDEDFVISAFAIHLRTLLDFFYPEGEARPTDVLARHFFEVPDRWQPPAKRPAPRGPEQGEQTGCSPNHRSGRRP
jgi:hypothetical protein